MKLECPHCRSLLPQNILGKEPSPVRCPHCSRETAVEALIAHNVESLSRRRKVELAEISPKQIPALFEKLSEVVRRPPSRKISAEVSRPYRLRVRIRGPQWTGTCFFLLFALIWNGGLVTPITKIFLSCKIAVWWGQAILLGLMLLIWPVGMLTLAAALFYLYGRTEILLDSKICRMCKSISDRGPRQVREVPTEKIQGAEFDGAHIAILSGSGSMNFGSGLSHFEKTWLLVVLNSLLQIVRNAPAEPAAKEE